MFNRIAKPVFNFLTNNECDAIIEGKFDLDKLKNKILNTAREYFITEFNGYELSEIDDIEINLYKPNQKYTNFNKIEDGFLSFVIQLNNEYDEGFFQFSFKDDNYHYQMYPGKGHMLLFFSNLNHRTVPVKKGIKYTLNGTIRLKKRKNYKKTII
jgi:hypothetical protein